MTEAERPAVGHQDEVLVLHLPREVLTRLNMFGMGVYLLIPITAVVAIRYLFMLVFGIGTVTKQDLSTVGAMSVLSAVSFVLVRAHVRKTHTRLIDSQADSARRAAVKLFLVWYDQSVGSWPLGRTRWKPAFQEWLSQYQAGYHPAVIVVNADHWLSEVAGRNASTQALDHATDPDPKQVEVSSPRPAQLCVQTLLFERTSAVLMLFPGTALGSSSAPPTLHLGGAVALVPGHSRVVKVRSPVPLTSQRLQYLVERWTGR